MSIRHIAAPIAGIICGSAVVALVETIGHTLFPIAPRGATDAATLRAVMVSAPLGALALVVAGWWAGAFAGVWAALTVAPGRPVVHAAIVAGVLLLATVANLVMLPHPLWMVVVGPLGIVAAAWLAGRLAAHRPSR